MTPSKQGGALEIIAFFNEHPPVYTGSSCSWEGSAKKTRSIYWIGFVLTLLICSKKAAKECLGFLV